MQPKLLAGPRPSWALSSGAVQRPRPALVPLHTALQQQRSGAVQHALPPLPQLQQRPRPRRPCRPLAAEAIPRGAVAGDGGSGDAAKRSRLAGVKRGLAAVLTPLHDPVANRKLLFLCTGGCWLWGVLAVGGAGCGCGRSCVDSLEGAGCGCGQNCVDSLEVPPHVQTVVLRSSLTPHAPHIPHVVHAAHRKQMQSACCAALCCSANAVLRLHTTPHQPHQPHPTRPKDTTAVLRCAAAHVPSSVSTPLHSTPLAPHTQIGLLCCTVLRSTNAVLCLHPHP